LTGSQKPDLTLRTAIQAPAAELRALFVWQRRPLWSITPLTVPARAAGVHGHLHAKKESIMATSGNWAQIGMVAGAIIAASLWIASAAQADDHFPKFDPKDMVPLIHGPNWVDLDGDGHLDLVMKSRFEINSPHSASIYSFHRHAQEEEYFVNWPEWIIIPIINLDSKEPHGSPTISTFEGADCILRDVRLVQTNRHGKGLKTFLILGERDLADGFWDIRPFKFKIYEMLTVAPNEETQFYVRVAFRVSHTLTSTEKYCGATEAFFREFGFPNPEAKHDDRR
jgi:hypothetical protein